MLTGTPLEDRELAVTGCSSPTAKDASCARASACSWDPVRSAPSQISCHYALSATQNQPFSFTLFACCLPLRANVQAGSPLPPGLSLSSSGVLSGTPTTAGQSSFRVRVFDPDFPSNFAVRQFELTVTPLIYFAPTNLPFANKDVLYRYQLANPGGGLTGSVTWTEAPGGLPPPPGLSVLEETPGVWVVTGTPLSAGQFNFNLIVSQGGFSRNVAFQLSIYPAGATPPINLMASGTFGPFRVGRVQINLPVSDGQPPYSVVEVDDLGVPVPDGRIPGMHIQNLDEPQPANTPANTATLLGVITSPGTYTTRIRATDGGGGSIERSVTIVVSPLAITSVSPLPSAVVNQPYTHTVTGRRRWNVSLDAGVRIDAGWP